jgi:ATP-dependent DNA helicase RecQ
MNGYIQTEGCREAYIRRYFGEENVSSCGHCDNCLDSNAGRGEAPTGRDISQMRDVLGKDREGLSLDEMKRNLRWEGPKIEQSLSYLLRENKVVMEDEKYRWRE